MSWKSFKQEKQVLTNHDSYFSSATFAVAQNIHALQLDHQISSSKPPQQNLTRHASPSQPGYQDLDHLLGTIPSSRAATPATISKYSFSYFLRALGLLGLVSSSQNSESTTTSVSISTPLPPPFNERKFVLELVLRHLSLQWPGITLLRGSIGLKNRVRDNADIMIACRSGSEDIVRSLFWQRVASPNDISDTSEALTACTETTSG